MSTDSSTTSGSLPIVMLLVVVATTATAAGVTRERWLPWFVAGEQQGILERLEQHNLKNAHDDHGHESHADGTVLQLSQRGLKNIGYEPFDVELASYERKLSLPAIVVERPGRSQLHVAAPLTGIVTKIHSVTGEAVEPGQVLFELRLTHEDLVASQRDFLRTVENLGVVNREIQRLETLSAGVVAGRRILEQKYEQQKLEASLHAEAQAMLLHGLSQAQVDKIRETRKLFQMIEIKAPAHDHHSDSCSVEHPFQIQRLAVTQGQQVAAGSELAVLADHCELLIEGMAFEDDALEIRQASQADRKITAKLLVGNSSGLSLDDLEVLYVADKIDAESRAFNIYLRLPNQLVAAQAGQNEKRFVEWVFKPGQRMQLEIPVETWEKQLVLPVTAVVDEGAEAYVYRQHGDHFDQVAVHVVHRDRDSVVVASDGALSPGVVIAGQGAYQIHLAIKNQSGGAIDPHAGHSH